jgi:hypothetical protein
MHRRMTAANVNPLTANGTTTGPFRNDHSH